MPQPTVVIGVDIGGTKIQAGAIEVNLNGTSDRVVITEEIPTPRVTSVVFYGALAELIRKVREDAAQVGCVILPLVAVAHPGRFLQNGTLARSTTPNLGTSPDQFDGLHPAHELERRLDVRVIAENDAIAQMRFGLDLLLRDPQIRPQLLRQTVVYLGPGTGMGGGVAQVDQEGTVRPVTDGHFFDMQVSGYEDGTLTTEELLTGPAIARRVVEANATLTPPVHPARGGRLDELLLDSEAPSPQRAVAQRIADHAGDILACIIETIASGRIVKVRLEMAANGQIRRHINEPDRAWSAEDQALVRGVRRVIFGGFVGCSLGLGARVRQRALEALRTRGLPDVQIFQIPATSGDAGVLGIVRAISHEQIRSAIHAVLGHSPRRDILKRSSRDYGG